MKRFMPNLQSLLKTTCVVASTVCLVTSTIGGWLAQSAIGQDAEPRYRTLPLDPAGEKRKKEKDDLFNPEKFNVAGIEAYYRENLLPRLLQENAASMNEARVELIADIEKVENKGKSNPKMLEDYNKMLARILLDVISTKDQNGKLAHPSARIVAAVVAGRMNRQTSNSSGGLPEPEATKILLRIFAPTENDGLVAAALTHLPRHWVWPGMDATKMEQARKRFVTNAETFLAAQKPGARGQEEESYLRELLVENLTIIANGESESAKAARPLLISLLKPALQKYKSESEWLVETAIQSFGQIDKPELTPEEITDFETQTIKFLQASLRSWNRRCAQTNYSLSGLGGKFAGGGMGGEPGGDTPDGGGAGGKPGGGGGGRFGQPGNQNKKNPFDEQPKEVKVARRILQQRLEKIHYGLNGYGKTNASTPTKGLVVVVEEGRKAKLNDVIEAIEAVQKALNDEKVSELGQLISTTRTSISALQTACEAIVGSDGQFDLAVEPDTSEGNDSEEGSGDEFDK
ncbi:MAG: hypothetical protein ACK5AC_15560 [Planctomycetota bacterium]|jgi:hypothetical protein